jgi:malate dehydrogenase (oxaloacetate-decarboxylating)
LQVHSHHSLHVPGLALGIVASQSRRVSDAMIMTAARTLAGLSPVEQDRNANLLPPLAKSRALSRVIATAVAKQAIAEGLSDLQEDEVDAAIAANIWEPQYLPYERIYE